MKGVLPVIVISQFFCTSLWFAGNAIVPDIIQAYHLDPSFLVHLTSAVQFGFISGTLVFAVLSIADRFSPSKVFFICSIIAATFNLGIIMNGIDSSMLLFFRFFTGFFLAGIYPVGMKIASDHFSKDLSKSLGFLVGALVLGTAFPHLLKSIGSTFPWKYVICTTSLLSVIGGVLILSFVPDGPYRVLGNKMNLSAFVSGFKNKDFRSASFGYFGHMWELYTFWAFVPVMLTSFNSRISNSEINIALWSFIIIASGGLSCVCGGLLARKFGSKIIATICLSFSGLCCFLSPLFLMCDNAYLLLGFLFFWGLVVIADSPLFSTLVAQHAPQRSRGSALTVVNCIGFSITIISIQFINIISASVGAQYLYLFLAVGPLLGVIALLNRNRASEEIISQL